MTSLDTQIQKASMVIALWENCKVEIPAWPKIPCAEPPLQTPRKTFLYGVWDLKSGRSEESPQCIAQAGKHPYQANCSSLEKLPIDFRSRRLAKLTFGSPGRWHASLVIKMVLVKLIQNYDFRLEVSGERVKWFWETFQMPYERTRVLMRKRNICDQENIKRAH